MTQRNGYPLAEELLAQPHHLVLNSSSSAARLRPGIISGANFVLAASLRIAFSAFAAFLDTPFLFP
jgi:hypothetical protein